MGKMRNNMLPGMAKKLAKASPTKTMQGGSHIDPNAGIAKQAQQLQQAGNRYKNRLGWGLALGGPIGAAAVWAFNRGNISRLQRRADALKAEMKTTRKD